MNNLPQSSQQKQQQRATGKTQGLNLEPPLRVLDAVIIDPSLWSKAQGLAPDDFFDEVHRAVFSGMQTLYSRNQKIGERTVRPRHL